MEKETVQSTRGSRSPILSPCFTLSLAFLLSVFLSTFPLYVRLPYSLAIFSCSHSFLLSCLFSLSPLLSPFCLHLPPFFFVLSSLFLLSPLFLGSPSCLHVSHVLRWTSAVSILYPPLLQLARRAHGHCSEPVRCMKLLIPLTTSNYCLFLGGARFFRRIVPTFNYSLPTAPILAFYSDPLLSCVGSFPLELLMFPVIIAFFPTRIMAFFPTRSCLMSYRSHCSSESKRKTANLVTIRKGERTFGLDGLANAIKYPQNGFRYLGRLLGKNVSCRR